LVDGRQEVLGEVGHERGDGGQVVRHGEGRQPP
jgi:hypothetical protein